LFCFYQLKCRVFFFFFFCEENKELNAQEALCMHKEIKTSDMESKYMISVFFLNYLIFKKNLGFCFDNFCVIAKMVMIHKKI
jgi:hypothetical protein